MKVSFVIPAFNEENTIVACIQSIQEEIERVSCDAEIIIVNNGSTDTTKEKALSCKGVYVVDESRKGIVWARKTGYETSTGDLIANIDADNILPKGWLGTVLKAFMDPKLYALSGPVIYYDLPLFMRVATRVFLFGGYLLNFLNRWFGSASMLQGGNFILRREALKKIGGYDTSIQFYGEDTDVGKRVSQVGKVVWTFKLPIYSSGRRIRTEGLFRTGYIYALNYLSVTYRKKPATVDYTDIRR
jgi:glycosyltransferase involved in cell wall biosynthesis